MKQPIRVGLLAYGMSGKVFHMPLLSYHTGFQVNKILQRNHNKVSVDYPEIEVVKTQEDLLADPDIELIIVNTPEATHTSLCKAALEAGKHVVVEKAFTTTAQEADELIALAQEKQLLLSVFQNRRWDSDFLTIRKIVEDGLIGRLVSYEAHFDRYRTFIKPATWKEEDKAGTGILYNLGSHLIDQTLVLFGLPQEVQADLRIVRTHGKVPDYFELKLFYPSFSATLKASYLVRGRHPKFSLFGEMGSFIKYGMDTQEDALKKGIIYGTEGWGEEEKTNWGTLDTNLNGLDIVATVESIPGNYLAFYENIYRNLRESAPLAVQAETAKATIQIIEAAYESWKTGSRMSIIP
ncbi:MAG: Gfo/Idh/MocA family oxidoreductase [Bacteroidota bacterium]